MERWIAFYAGVLAFVAATVWLAPASQAQVVRLFGSDADIKALLHAQGYDRLDIVDRGLSSTTFQACYGTDRVQFKFYWDGKIGGRRVIGGCRIMISEEDARRILASRGYERINIEDRAGAYLAVACRQGTRFRINVTHHGDIRSERQIGECRDTLTPADIEPILVRQGYDRIRFTDRQLPEYIAMVCRGEERYELSLNRFGEIRSRTPAGSCPRPVSPAELPAILAEKGLNHVKVTDARLPRYKAEGCRGDMRVEVRVSRFGEILDEIRIGRCQPELNLRQIRELLAQTGFRQIDVTENRREGFIAVACRQNDRYELVLNRFGQVRREDRLGRCPARTVTQIRSELEKRGLSNIELQAEACSRGRRMLVLLDEYGEITATRRIGSC